MAGLLGIMLVSGMAHWYGICLEMQAQALWRMRALAVARSWRSRQPGLFTDGDFHIRVSVQAGSRVTSFYWVWIEVEPIGQRGAPVRLRLYAY